MCSGDWHSHWRGWFQDIWGGNLHRHGTAHHPTVPLTEDVSTGSVQVNCGEYAHVAVLGQGLASLGGHDGPAKGCTTHKRTTEGAEMTTNPNCKCF